MYYEIINVYCLSCVCNLFCNKRKLTLRKKEKKRKERGGEKEEKGRVKNVELYLTGDTEAGEL